MAMRDVPLPPLHAAIWDGDVERVREILHEYAAKAGACAEPGSSVAELLERRDAHGHSPLHLAVRVMQPAQREIVQLLLVHGARVGARSLLGWSCLQDAALCDDEFLLAQLFLRGERQLWAQVATYQDSFLDALERLPDFEMEIAIETYSWVPGVSTMLPSQLNRLWKRGSQLRVDCTTLGLERLQLRHGTRISHVFTGRDDRRALVLNHDTQTLCDVTKALSATSTLSKMDLGLHLLLTKEQSSMAIDSSQLEFRKVKDVATIKTKRKHGDARRVSPWSGAKYEMKHLTARFEFRAPVNPRRVQRNFASQDIETAERALGSWQTFVDDLAGSSSTTSSAKRPQDASGGLSSHASAPVSSPHGAQEIWLAKGQKVEMHLDVLAGDTVGWDFRCKSKEFSFSAVFYHDDRAQPVCRSDGVKNTAIVGAFTAESNGGFVLSWTNTQRGFSLDKRGIRLLYSVSHTRPPTEQARSNQQDEATSDASPRSAQRQLSSENDEELALCRRFLRPEHIPNAMTTTVSLRDYAAGPSPPESTSTSLSKRAPPSAADASTAHYKNTFRSLTLLPTTKRFRKSCDAKLFMAQDFPIQTQDFLPILEFLSQTGEQVKSMADFFRMKLPPGFPVRFELPMMFTVRAAYTFQKAELRTDIDPSLFTLPANYAAVDSIKDVLPQQTTTR
ncbi:hypothetical protein P43SY_000664 [Pythium insidiosum]|uniref:Ankyrin repeat domain-containing protein n=1 Tax=Pythium insidiosum TaxID=114742 RepID=A0AAD5LMZ3_PYTIN|nr:hypothetical protein P43SY_000664 [Pythium insidiosum]